MNILARYTRWLHTRWPSGTVEKLPQVNDDGSTSVPGLYIVGDLTGIPLLRFSADTGARAVRTITADSAFQRQRQRDDATLDLVIIGGGVSGMSAALEARAAGLRFELLEATEPFATIVNFPKGKPIYTYPSDMTPAGQMHFRADVKEDLVRELRDQTLATGIQTRAARAERVVRDGDLLRIDLAGDEPLRARRVVVAIGRSGNFRRLGAAGEDLDKVYNRLHDPRDFRRARALVVGGGDSALESAIALAECGATVTLSYRKAGFSRPKPDNIARIERLRADPSSADGTLTLAMNSTVTRIEPDRVTLKTPDGERTIDNDVVFAMIGREAPLDFFRRSGVRIAGEMTGRDWTLFGAFLAFCVFLYHWKKDRPELPVYRWFRDNGWFPFNLPGLVDALGGGLATAAATEGHLLHVLLGAMKGPSFYYTLAYSLCVLIFGLRRIRRRRTPYVKLQTWTLIAIQCLPLFLLPEIILPWAGQNGWFDSGVMGWIGDQLFPGGSYWRAYGLVLAWPLFVFNVFTDQPLWGWLLISVVQTFVLIPTLIYFYGKGAYCGWICSCGALAETLGDAHRHKMPHGPFWNRLNMVGQVILGLAVLLLGLRVLSWIRPGGWLERTYALLLGEIPFLNYTWSVDLLLAGVLGVGCYFWFSGRVWCRFACPLAALMHIYARFSRFRILADKKKCISCNVCTSVCHQGIDVMNFANKGLPMEDPECVRCSACVQSCPTGVLAFGQVDPRTGAERGRDRLAASLVQLTENGRAV